MSDVVHNAALPLWTPPLTIILTGSEMRTPHDEPESTTLGVPNVERWLREAHQNTAA